MGPLPKAKSGHQYLLTMIDRSTRFPEITPLRSIQSKVIIKHLKDFIGRYGVPKEIQTDRGTNFTSRLFQRKVSEFGIKQVFSTPYHPQSQGVLERFHATLKNALSKYTLSNLGDWEENLPFVLYAIRSSPNETLGFSPYELVYGHNVRGPLDMLKENWESSKSNKNMLQYILDFKEKLNSIHAWVKSNGELKPNEMKLNYNKKAKQRHFEVGDSALVLLPIPGQLKVKYSGSGIIRRKVNDPNYEVELPGRRKKVQTFHINLLKLYHSRETAIMSLNTSCIESDNIVGIKYTWPNENSQVLETLSDKLDHLSFDRQGYIKQLCNEFPSIFRDTPGLVAVGEHEVRLKPNSKPIRQAPYRMNPEKAKVVKGEVEYMLKNNLIEPSDSQWSSPVVVVKKENGTDRLCMDYREINSLTEPDSFPLPRIEDCVDKVGKSKYVSKFDLLKGYWQVPLSDNALILSAFVTPDGLFECKVMPFGMKNAASTFQRLLWIVTKDLSNCLTYLDDIVIFSDTWQDHLNHIRALFTAIANFNLVMNLSKCEFGKSEIVYLGHKIGGGKVMPKSQNVEAIQNFPVPQSIKGVKQFLGITGYYRKFVPCYSDIASPLTELLKCKKFKWNDECNVAFEILKSILSSYPILRSPDYEKDFKLMVDASDLGIGAVLLQSDDGVDHAVSYFSRKINPAQRKYSTIEKETMALVLALKHFEIYATVEKNPLKVFTDHNPLKYLAKFKDNNRRLHNWSLILQDFNIEIEHVKGKENVIADALSRNFTFT